MSISSFVVKFLAKQAYRQNIRNQKNAIEDQNNTYKSIIAFGRSSHYGKNFNITSNFKYNEYAEKIPVSKYENYKEYISLISKGEKNILTTGKPIYFAITSGTTSGTKYIPLTQKMWNYHTLAIKELLLLYAYQKNDFNFSNTAMMFIQGSPELKYYNKIPFAKLSGIAARHIPFYLKKNRYPSVKTNKLQPWEKKIDTIVLETYNKNMKILGGIPPWVITYFQALLKYTKQNTVNDVFKNLKLYIHGGTSIEPYKNTFSKLCSNIDTLEVYPASEGFFGYQNCLNDKSLLLLTNHGVFYEFISLEDFRRGALQRIPLEDVKLHIDYVMIVSTVSGLWAYNTGDTVRFVSKNPYKIMFSGRASQYCSAFGEHVIEKEIQTALLEGLKVCGGSVVEFTVCPKVGEDNFHSCHQWFVEFSEEPSNLLHFEKILNQMMEKQNIYYSDLVQSNIIAPLKVIAVKNGGFNAYMKSIGKFGGQNKCPHLSNERKIGDYLLRNYV
ncbi:MAG: hypothetical protein CMP49_00665 [Flavobacteriales bacterium]|nr:hypothetical protein [Flavobacteriales bacterium]|tara:strand:+ start:48 stop:1541 length:1494 start_codon:yes stop_codon:yes gene_type:complete